MEQLQAAFLSIFHPIKSRISRWNKRTRLRKINQLQPDLIIISGRQRDFQKDLSQIAPTIFLSLDAKNPWESFQQNVTALGEIFGKQEEAKTQLEELSSAIDQTKKKAEATDKKH